MSSEKESPGNHARGFGGQPTRQASPPAYAVRFVPSMPGRKSVSGAGEGSAAGLPGAVGGVAPGVPGAVGGVAPGVPGDVGVTSIPPGSFLANSTISASAALSAASSSLTDARASAKSD